MKIIFLLSAEKDFFLVYVEFLNLLNFVREGMGGSIDVRQNMHRFKISLLTYPWRRFSFRYPGILAVAVWRMHCWWWMSHVDKTRSSTREELCSQSRTGMRREKSILWYCDIVIFIVNNASKWNISIIQDF